MRPRPCSLLLVVALVLAACDGAPAEAPDGGGDGPPPPAWAPFCRERMDVQACRRNLVIAHRGGGRLAPEESMEAFANAFMLGADVLETDVHATSDGVIVCMHDATVDRTTDGMGAI